MPHLPFKALSLAIAMAALAPAAIAADATTRDYHLAAGPLADVLARFAANAGVPLSFDPALLQGRQSQGLQGSFSVPEGFARLLAGSGYSLISTGSGGLHPGAGSGRGQCPGAGRHHHQQQPGRQRRYLARRPGGA